MDDSGSAPNTSDANEQPPAEHTPVAGAPGADPVRSRTIPTSTLVLGAILLVVVAFLGGWVGGHHAARQADRMAFGSFMRQRENGSGPGYGIGSGSGYGFGYDPRYAPGHGSWCAPCYGSTNGVAVPCSSGMPGFSPGGTGSGQTVPTAVPGTGGSQGSGS